jgi:putative nucleotidyltransferase with HDIG domain
MMSNEFIKTEATTSDQARTKRVEMIVRQLETLPTLPVVATKVLQATTAKGTSGKEIISLIESDQSLTAKILGLTRKAHLGLGDTVTTVDKAVVMLGFDAIRSAVLSVQVFEAFGPDKSDSSGDSANNPFQRKEFWKHSLAVACAAQMIVEQLPAKKKLDADEIFVCGLLHDIGKVALDTCLPKSFSRVVEIAVNNRTSIADVERRILGMDHAAIGKRLAEHWQLPPAIVHAIWLHHHKSNTLPENIPYRDLIDVIYLADLIAREQRIGFSGNFLLPYRSEPLAQQMGISSIGYEKILLDLRKRMGERAALIGLDEINSEELYQQALQAANSELGRLNQSLTIMNRKLNSRSRYFEAINGLHSQLNPNMPVVEMLENIARAVRSALDVTSIIAFRKDAENRFIESAYADENGVQSKLFELTGYNIPAGEKKKDEKSFLLDPPGELTELITHYVRHMTPNPIKMIPLTCKDQMIGGILIATDALLEDRLIREKQEIEALCTTCGLTLGQSLALESKEHMADELLVLTRQMQELEEKLVEVRCIAAVGELAAGAAHELNNPLAIISGRAQLLQDQEPDSDKSKALEVIVNQAKRASEIITELMDFAKPVKPQSKTIRLEELLKRQIDSFSENQKLKPGQIQVEIGKQAQEVYCDEQQLASAIKEIYTNAVEAHSKIDDLKIKIQTVAEDDGEHLQIRIEDNGPGMEPSVLNRALDPFFSAKKAGRGRGLGLSRAYRYIQSNKGNLWLESTQGMGTTAFIRLPIKKNTGMEAKG